MKIVKHIYIYTLIIAFIKIYKLNSIWKFRLLSLLNLFIHHLAYFRALKNALGSASGTVWSLLLQVFPKIIG